MHYFLVSTSSFPCSDLPNSTLSSQSRPNLDPNAPDLPNEDGEAMDDANDDDDAAMMAIMGLSNFGSTKVCRWYHLIGVKLIFHAWQRQAVAGNQEGAVNIKKVRTWRQYMNRWVVFLATLFFWNKYSNFLLGAEGSTGMHSN